MRATPASRGRSTRASLVGELDLVVSTALPPPPSCLDHLQLYPTTLYSVFLQPTVVAPDGLPAIIIPKSRGCFPHRGWKKKLSSPRIYGRYIYTNGGTYCTLAVTFISIVCAFCGRIYPLYRILYIYIFHMRLPVLNFPKRNQFGFPIRARTIYDNALFKPSPINL